MALTPEEEQELASLKSEYARLSGLFNDYVERSQSEAQSVGQRQMASGAYMPSFTPEQQEKLAESTKTATVGALRYGVPAIGAIASGGASIPIQMGIGALTSLAGETGALGLEGEDLTSAKNLRKMGGSALAGSVPGIRNSVIGSALLSGAGNVAGEAVARGEEIGAGEATVLGGLPLILSGATAGLSKGVAGLSELARTGSETAQQIENIGPGVQATLGQAIPRFAGYEQRTSAKVGKEALDQFLNRQGEAIGRAVEAIGGPPVSERQVIENVLAGLNAREQQDIVAQIGDLNNAYEAFKATRDPVRRQIIQDTIQATEQGLQNRIVNQFMGGMPRPSRIVEEGRQLASDMQQARGAFSEEANRRYAPVNQYMTVRGFNLTSPVAPAAGGTATSVADEVARAFQNSPIYSGGQIIPAFEPYFSKLMPLLQPANPASLGELRVIRDSLYDAADHAGTAFGKPQQRNLQMIADKITQTINDQAPTVMGAGPARQLADANAFYAKYRPRFDQYGVQNAFASMDKRAGQMSKKMISEAEAEGLDTSSVSNYLSALENMNADRIPGTPSTARALDTIRTGLLNTVIDRVGANPQINFENLSRLANDLENQSPGSLARLGLGSRDDINRLINLRTGLREAPGTDQLLFLLNQNQPAGAALAPAIIAQIRGTQGVLPLMQSLQRNAINGNMAARQALINIRANEINDLLINSSKLGSTRPNIGTATRTPRLEALQDISDRNLAERYEITLGIPLLNRIRNDVIPGFAALQRAKQTAAGAGTAVGGTAFERPITSAINVPVKAAGGKLASGLISFATDVADLVGYQTLARIFAQAGGATGLRNVSRQLDGLSRNLSGLSRPQAIQVLTDYAENGILKKSENE